MSPLLGAMPRQLRRVTRGLFDERRVHRNAERNQFEQYDNVRKRTFRRTPPPPMLPAIFRGTAVCVHPAKLNVGECRSTTSELP